MELEEVRNSEIPAAAASTPKLASEEDDSRFVLPFVLKRVISKSVRCWKHLVFYLKVYACRHHIVA